MNKEELINYVKNINPWGLRASEFQKKILEAVDQLDEPAHEPVEVPTAIYDDIIWHEKLGYDKTYTIWSIMDGLEDDTYDFGIKEWIRSHDDELIKAVVYGCKPIKKRWV